MYHCESMSEILCPNRVCGRGRKRPDNFFGDEEKPKKKGEREREGDTRKTKIIVCFLKPIKMFTCSRPSMQSTERKCAIR
jgi:hypothetical protein